jgi:hypothetical protein
MHYLPEDENLDVWNMSKKINLIKSLMKNWFCLFLLHMHTHYRSRNGETPKGELLGLVQIVILGYNKITN